jgi:hypothetical protein
VTVADQFGADSVRVEQPEYFCNPVVRVHNGVTTRIEEKELHLTCYDIKAPQRTEATSFGVMNQFGRAAKPASAASHPNRHRNRHPSSGGGAAGRCRERGCRPRSDER